MRGVWCVVRGAGVHGAWCVVCGTWCVVRGAWCVVRCVVCGVLCMVRGAWCSQAASAEEIAAKKRAVPQDLCSSTGVQGGGQRATGRRSVPQEPPMYPWNPPTYRRDFSLPPIGGVALPQVDSIHSPVSPRSLCGGGRWIEFLSANPLAMCEGFAYLLGANVRGCHAAPRWIYRYLRRPRQQFPLDSTGIAGYPAGTSIRRGVVWHPRKIAPGTK